MSIVLINGVPTEVGEGASEIISLRQQLAESQAHIDWLNDHCSVGWDSVDDLTQQLSERDKQIVMLREALETVVANLEPYCAITRAVDNQCRHALSATEPKP